MTGLHEETLQWVCKVAKAKQVREEAIASAQKQYAQSLKECNAAVEAASKR